MFIQIIFTKSVKTPNEYEFEYFVLGQRQHRRQNMSYIYDIQI